jgi:outer membrane protein TolC
LTQLELTDAEVALRQSEFNYAQAVYDYLAARARLDEAVGRVPLVDEAGGSEGAS